MVGGHIEEGVVRMSHQGRSLVGCHIDVTLRKEFGRRSHQHIKERVW